MTEEAVAAQETNVSASIGEGGETGEVMDSTDSAPGHSLRHNLVVLAGGQLTTWLMTLLWTLVVPRLLGPSGMGLIAAVWAVAGILSIPLGLGSTSYLVRQLVAEPASSGRLVGTAVVLRVLTIPMFVASAVAFAHFAHYGSDARLVLWLATAATLVTSLDDPIMAAFQAGERMQYLAYSDVINRSAQGLVGILIVVVGFGAVGLTISWLAVSVVVLVLCFGWIRPMVDIKLRTTTRQLWALVRASLPYFASGVFYAFYFWIDSVMLSLMTRNEVVGWYAVPTKLLGTLLFVPVIVSTAWGPRLVRTFETAADDFPLTARKPVELVLILSLPLCAITALAARPLIPLLYGSAYLRSVPVMVILGFTLIPMYANIIFAPVLVAMRRQVRLTMVMVGAAIVNPALNYVLIRFTESRYHNGAIGAAICLLLTELLVVVADLFFLGRELVSSWSLLRVTRAALASGILWAVGELARPLGWYVSLPLAGVAFLLSAWLLRLAGPEEQDAIRSGVARVTARLHRARPI
jgi:O-antigen/teichoic acid export membrane protein